MVFIPPHRCGVTRDTAETFERSGCVSSPEEEAQMRVPVSTALLVGLAVALPACQKNQPDQNISITNNIPADADIEALPPDESSETTTNELAGGSDNADVTDLNAANNAY